MIEKVVKLKDGRDVIIRTLRSDDIDRSFAFFQSLPASDIIYLRRNVRNIEIAKERIQEIESGKIKRLVAVHDDNIIADGSLELESHGWKSHIGELRLIVAHEFRRQGLGMIMARELYLLAVKENVQEIVVKMMHPQAAAIRIFKKLGFKEDVIIHDYVKDLKDRKQDLIIMRCDLNSLWQELEDYFTGPDWKHMR